MQFNWVWMIKKKNIEVFMIYSRDAEFTFYM